MISGLAETSDHSADRRCGLKTVLYADVLLLVNFSMDFISLYLTFLLMRRRLSAVRGAVAAFLGGLFGVIMTYFDLSGLLAFLLNFSVSLLMMLTCLGFGLKLSYYLKYTVFLWGAGALLAGGVTLVCNLGSFGDVGMPSFKNRGASALFVLSLGAALTRAAVKVITASPRARECTVDICSFGKRIKASAMVDSGNLVTEAVSGLPVVFVRKGLFSKSGLEDRDIELLSNGISGLEALSPDIKRRVRVVSVKRVGETRLLAGIVSSELFVATGKNKKRLKAVMVIEDVGDYGGYDALVPEAAVL